MLQKNIYLCPPGIRLSNTQQSTNSLIAQPLSGSPKCAFLPRHSIYSMSRILIAAVGTFFIVFSYDAVKNTLPPRRRADVLLLLGESSSVHTLYYQMEIITFL